MTLPIPPSGAGASPTPTRPSDGATPTTISPPIEPAAPSIAYSPARVVAPAPAVPAPMAASGRTRPDPAQQPRMELRDVSVRYGERPAVRDVSIRFPQQAVTALIGPSGCGKSTVLRCLNRMNDLIPSALVEGLVTLDGEDIYADGVDPVEVRRRIGLIFQRPNPFPMTIYDNVAYGPRRRGVKDRARLDETVEHCLRQAALWDEVESDFRKKSGLALSGGQQQRLCIARALATEPEVLLMDEPASALDPISTLRIEELMDQLRQTYTIVIVTHNMQQAARVSDLTAFFSLGEDRVGYLVEVDDTTRIFTNPRERLTEDYVSGRFG